MLSERKIIDRKRIDSIAKDMRTKIFGNSLDNSNLESYLEYAGIDVRYINSSEVDGYLRWDSEKTCPVIAISITGNALVRQRYIMAHELGHLVLDWDWKPLTNQGNQDFVVKVKDREFLDIFSYRSSTYSSEEKIIDEFAVAFLIPENKLRQVIHNFIVDYTSDDCSQLADELAVEVSSVFKVSNVTARFRLKNFLANITRV